MKKLFKIYDNQLNEYKNDGQWYTINEAIDALANYHDNDWTGVDDNDEPKTIYQWLDEMKDDDDRLSTLMEYGDWDLHYFIYKSKKDDTICYGGEYDRPDKVEEYLSENPDQTAECRYYYTN